MVLGEFLFGDKMIVYCKNVIVSNQNWYLKHLLAYINVFWGGGKILGHLPYKYMDRWRYFVVDKLCQYSGII